jgi:hypothetical protein
MSTRTIAAAFCAGSALLFGTAGYSVSSETASHFAFQPVTRRAEPEQTASVTLGKLSVTQSPMDRPWDPHVCIGCDRNNGSPFDKKVGRGAHAH